MNAAIFQPFPMLDGRRAQAWRHQPQFRRPRHFHAEPEINLVVRGTCELSVGESVATLGAGAVMLFAPGQDHALLRASEDLELFVAAVTPELAARVLGPRAVLPASRQALAPGELKLWVERLSALANLGDAQRIEQLLGESFVAAVEGASRGHVLSRRALEAVLRDPSISEQELSAQLGAGASGISRRFREHVGLTLVEHRARVRLMAFVAAVDGGQTLTSAAFEAGFGSYAQCHRVFRRVLGQSPREYFSGGRAAVADATFAPR